jgi:hypothetical protein
MKLFGALGPKFFDLMPSRANFQKLREQRPKCPVMALSGQSDRTRLCPLLGNSGQEEQKHFGFYSGPRCI